MSQLRQAQESDFEFVYDLYMHPRVNPFMAYEIMPKDQFLPIFKNELLKRDYFWIFSNDNTDVGMCSAVVGATRMSHVANIRTVAIHPNAQGKQFGLKMMQMALDDMAENKALKRVTLEVESDNPKAQPLYEKCGFVVDGICPRNFRRAGEDRYIDHIMMSKWIGE